MAEQGQAEVYEADSAGLCHCGDESGERPWKRLHPLGQSALPQRQARMLRGAITREGRDQEEEPSPGALFLCPTAHLLYARALGVSPVPRQRLG